MGEKNRKRLSRREILDFFASLVVVVLIGRPCFFVGAAVSFAINRAVGLAIDGAVSTGTDIAISFSGLSLW